jgi:uncharacterized protein
MRSGLTALLLLSLAAPGAAQDSGPRPGAVALSYRNGDVSLRGWLELPAGQGPFPAVVMIPGNGSWRAARPWIHVHVAELLKSGIAVLYYDHRGEGETTGTWETASFEQLADDAIAGARAIRTTARIDSTRVGVWGHSMGGWIAPLAASRSRDIAFVVTAAGPGVNALQQNAFNRLNEDLVRGVPRDDALEMNRFRRELALYYTYPTKERYAIAAAALVYARSRPWFERTRDWQEMRSVRTTLPTPQDMALPRVDSMLAAFRRDNLYEPAGALQLVKVPMLAIFAGNDITVPNDLSMSAMQTAFRMSGSESLLTVAMLPRATHGLLVKPFQGNASDFAAEYFPLLTKWILDRTRVSR